MATTQKKTRGQRAHHERRSDAARSAATLLEDAPDDGDRNGDIIQDVAVMLRLYFGSASERRAVNARESYSGLLARMRWWRVLHPELAAQPGKTNGELLEELEDLCKELIQRVANYVDIAGESQEAKDEGLLLAVKLYRLLGDAQFGGWGNSNSLTSMKRDLEV